jgi:hypothetical protein
MNSDKATVMNRIEFLYQQSIYYQTRLKYIESRVQSIWSLDPNGADILDQLNSFRDKFNDIFLSGSDAINNVIEILSSQGVFTSDEIAIAMEKQGKIIDNLTSLQNKIDFIKKELKNKYETVEIENEEPVWVEKTDKVKRSAVARSAIATAEILTHGVTGFFTLPITGIQKLFRVEDKNLAINQVNGSISREFSDDYYRNENVMTMTTKKVKSLQQKMVGVDEVRDDVTRMVPTVIKKEQEVGKEYQKGGYPVIENLLAIGIGIEVADADLDIQKHFEEIVSTGRIHIKQSLGRYEDTINQLVENNDSKIAEEQIITILERILLTK